MPGRASRPVIGVIANAFLINDTFPVSAAGEMNLHAVAKAAGCLPLVIPALPEAMSVPDLLDACDGFVFTGGRANVHPSHYGHDETEAHKPFDPKRDGVSLPLIRAAVDAGAPVLGICRGFQEMAVAFGATLHPEIRDLPGRMNHRMPPDGTVEEKFALRHKVEFREGGEFHRILGVTEAMTNTLHGQGVMETGPRVVIEGTAPDGTPEALSIRDAPGFALGAQWHVEWMAWESPVGQAVYRAFGDAARARAARRMAA
ncbi:gamma-glutamyl-gamma-aminobutyrate hydrolase family protein [Albimonas sp. CAU 1670]|uniref:gamma-glutamyl-gamma-aminobutyrate hydrolase family protein n=1 Tax=Albimonas sp. CAU 1670 TaxID=3032599 RepID=UPI0023DAD3F8|nr:gamma-glutamyl-gamma-aminobutyrate hydrolase family protein [Albimonas sp. CAU 1670]MDF2234502.1 gamma-glutamyl-gamma-aminobutyrate hydrolase family protein [Albimonas sp. CAU 1670]